MISGSKALIASFVSALVITVVHYFAHKLGFQVREVGVIIFIFTLFFAYFGMRGTYKKLFK